MVQGHYPFMLQVDIAVGVDGLKHGLISMRNQNLCRIGNPWMLIKRLQNGTELRITVHRYFILKMDEINEALSEMCLDSMRSKIEEFEFYDEATEKFQMIKMLSGSLWLCFKHVDGQWVTRRKLTVEDVAELANMHPHKQKEE